MKLSSLLNFCLTQFVFSIEVLFEEIPQNSIAYPGDTVYFTCSTKGNHEIYWTHNSSFLPSSTNKSFLSFPVSKNPREYAKQIGEYGCVADHSLASLPGKLSIALLLDFPTEKNKTVEAFSGNDVVLNCSVPFSNPKSFISFSKDGQTLSKSLIINNQQLYLKNISANDSGLYFCSAHNHIINESKNSKALIQLNVIVPKGYEKSKLNFKPREFYELLLGENLTLLCSASGHPKPTIFWEKDNVFLRTGGAFTISKARQEDAGIYMCTLFNGPRRFVRRTKVSILVPPFFTFLPPPITYLSLGEDLILHCDAFGSPSPSISWTVNGRPYSVNKTLIKSTVNLEDGGNYQCFIRSELGINMTISIVSVTQEDVPLEQYEYVRTIANIPSEPNITQRTHESVYLQWNLLTSPNTSFNIPIHFFKIQYREYGDETNSERDASKILTYDGTIESHRRAYEVLGLVSKYRYKFRIVAVYVNYDNKQGPWSKKFSFRLLEEERAPSGAPILGKVLPLGTTALRVGWKVRKSDSRVVEGYFIHYKPSLSSSSFKKVTIIGVSSHSFILESLSPGISYDIKVQAFNFAGTSPMSKTLSASTLASTTQEKFLLLSSTSPPSDSTNLKDSEVFEENNSSVTLYLIIGGILALIVLIVILICSLIGIFQRNKARGSFLTSGSACQEKFVTSGVCSRHFDSSSLPMTTRETTFSNLPLSLDSPPVDSLYINEYADEPSGVSWRRRYKSEDES